MVQELLRHSSLRSTLDVYTQTMAPSKQAAQGAVMSLVLNANGGPNSQLTREVWLVAPGQSR